MLKHTAESIFQQSSMSWEWIVIDGASNDGTAKWLNEISLSRSNVHFISEQDNGIFEAWNKALPIISGNWVLFLGAGDRLKDCTVIPTCEKLLEKVSQEVNLAYGFVEFVETLDQLKGIRSNERWEGIDGRWAWCRPLLPNHQGIFHRYEFLRNSGGFNSSYKIVGDAAKILPEFMKNGGVDLQTTIALRMLDGVSIRHENRAKVLLEIMRINQEVGLGNTRIFYQYSAFFYHMIKSGMRVLFSKLL